MGLRVSVKGSDNGRSKLTEDQVLSIRILQGEMTQLHIGKLYGVSEVAVSNIHRRKSWKHI